MYNQVGLQGRLTADPILKRTQSGTMVTSFTLACDTGRRNASDEKITYFIECVAWSQQAEFVCRHLNKGRLILVDGELSTRTYEDRNGQNRKAVEVIVRSVYFCDSKRDDQSTGQQPQSSSDFVAPDGFTPVEDDGDLPFR